ncbi:hypothetical protein IMG5_168290 [Ichthyophthirius multifiliis]|uniref:FHA domain-containing protein n=1 Tax=Ichthyophthirius multifiliis TaxID=5932 RepID=G0R126_ICHMU|nr:hypothetical protein IMG5_168290 [Ichthyophthirius multifiliis]EGR28793.1 hypothetical protein IMG5_168290 [Ichthyophthirius multifiliis]|eukprot:XP_004030029.1 hypothetical protein IMG5_168290 [Ichthyophthirius multifiliis]
MKLIIIDKDSQNELKKWKLKENKTYIIGRSVQADIQIQEESLSRKHAQIIISENSVQLQDLNSCKKQKIYYIFFKKMGHLQITKNQIQMKKQALKMKQQQILEIARIIQSLKIKKKLKNIKQMKFQNNKKIYKVIIKIRMKIQKKDLNQKKYQQFNKKRSFYGIKKVLKMIKKFKKKPKFMENQMVINKIKINSLNYWALKKK